jgi:hypothetical protein
MLFATLDRAVFAEVVALAEQCNDGAIGGLLLAVLRGAQWSVSATVFVSTRVSPIASTVPIGLGIFKLPEPERPHVNGHHGQHDADNH